MSDLDAFLVRFDRLADSNITSLEMVPGPSSADYVVTLMIDTIDDLDQYKSKAIKVKFSGVFDLRIALECHEVPFALGLGVAHARCGDGHYIQFGAPEFDRDIEEIRSGRFFIGFRDFSFEVLREITWD